MSSSFYVAFFWVSVFFSLRGTDIIFLKRAKPLRTDECVKELGPQLPHKCQVLTDGENRILGGQQKLMMAHTQVLRSELNGERERRRAGGGGCG